MKKLFYSLILTLAVFVGNTGLGANSGTPMGDTPYQFGSDWLWNQLGFGTRGAIEEFSMAQVYFADIDFLDLTDGVMYTTASHYHIERNETLADALYRTVNTELAKVTSDIEGHTLIYGGFLVASNGVSQFNLYGTEFIPLKNTEGVYTVPREVTDTIVPELRVVGGIRDIWWGKISRATLVVFDDAGNLVYNGDTLGKPMDSVDFSVTPGISLRVPLYFITNGFSGRLTVILKNGVSAVYDIKNGERLTNPQDSVKILLGFRMTPEGQQIFTINGCPKHQVVLVCSPSVTSATNSITSSENSSVYLTLDSAGMLTWTNSTGALKLPNGPMAIFTVRSFSPAQQSSP